MTWKRLFATGRATGPTLGRAAAGDVEAFGEFYERYSERVFLFIARRIYNPDVALDLTSETFASALAGCRKFRGSTIEEEQAWLFAIARSQLSHYWRRGKVEREAVQRLGIEVPTLGEAELERINDLLGAAALHSQVETGLDGLSDDHRQAIELRILEEREYADIAETLDVSEQVARSRVSRGLRALSRSLDEPGSDTGGSSP